MTYQLTKNQFDSIDFSDASSLMPELGTQIELNCWGLTLLTFQRWGEPLILPNIDTNDDTYIAT